MLALALFLAAAPVATVGVTTQAHGGTPQVWGLAPAELGAEFRIAPSLAVQFPGPAHTLELGYSPSLTWRTATPAMRPLLLHQGTLDWEGRFSDRLEGFGELSVRLGEEDYFRYLSSPDAPAGPDAFLPGADRMRLLRSRADAGVVWEASPRQTWRLHGFYFAHGGIDETSRRAVPFGHGPGLGAEGELRITPRDALVPEVEVSAPSYSNGPRYRLAETSLAWRRRLGPQTDIAPEVGAFGVLWADGVDPGHRVRPLAALTLDHHLGLHRTEGRLRARVEYAPRLNLLDGRPEDRLGGSLGLSWRWSPRFSTSLETGAAWVLDEAGRGDGLLLRAGLWSGYQLVPGHLRLEAGGSYYDQQLPSRLGGFHGVAWDVYLGLTANFDTR